MLKAIQVFPTPRGAKIIASPLSGSQGASIKERGGKSIAIASEGDREISTLADRVIHVPAATELLLPILEVVPLQLFAYHFATLNGCDVDHPRNLVKSVTTE